jgi:hypothetical protein
MKSDFEPISAELRRLFAAERDFTPELADLKARALVRARGSLRGAPRPSARVWDFRQARLLLVAATMVLAAGAFAKRSQLLELVSKPSASVPSAVVRNEASTPQATPVQAAEQSAPDVTSPAAAVRSEKKEAASATRPSSVTDPYQLELGLLQRARAAVASGRFSVALRAIAEHQRRFATGHLREEREALRVKALAGLGRVDEAHHAAENFREHFPDSVLSPRIEGAVREAP